MTRILTAFVREHAPWLVGSPGGPVHPTPELDDKLPWLSNRANDVQTAMHVLARRPVHRGEPRLLLTRTDLRGIYLPDARLDEAFLRRANLARAWMPGIHLERSEMGDADLRRAKLRGAYMSQADLRDAHLQQADLRNAVVRGADLRGADLTDALLEGADLTDIKTDGCGSFEVSWLRCEDEVFAVYGSVDALVLLAEVEAPVVLEIAGGDDGAEPEDGLGAFESPSRARYVQPFCP